MHGISTHLTNYLGLMDLDVVRFVALLENGLEPGKLGFVGVLRHS